MLNRCISRRCLRLTIIALTLGGVTPLLAQQQPAAPAVESTFDRDRMSPQEQAQAFLDLLAGAQSLIAAGNSDAALRAFQQTSEFVHHSAVAEAGMVRAYMRKLASREALAFAHMVAGEHRDSGYALALLCLLLDRVGHTKLALDSLVEAHRRAPDDLALVAAEAEIRIDRGMPHVAKQLMLEWIHRNGAHNDLERLLRRIEPERQDGEGRSVDPPRLETIEAVEAWSAQQWPMVVGDAFPVSPTALLGTSNGVLVEAGTQLLTVAPPSAHAARRVYVRLADGSVQAATRLSQPSTDGLVRLALDRPAVTAQPVQQARAAFGTLAAVVGFPLANGLEPVWPAASLGLFVASRESRSSVLVDAAVTPGQLGSPVFDRTGRVVGLVSASHGEGMPASIAPLVAIDPGVTAPTAAHLILTPDQIYELALVNVALVAWFD